MKKIDLTKFTDVVCGPLEQLSMDDVWQEFHIRAPDKVILVAEKKKNKGLTNYHGTLYIERKYFNGTQKS